MKRILFKSLPFILIFIILNIIFLKTSDFFKQENKYIERIETSINTQPEIIFLGDSHVETIKLMQLSEKIGNLAFGGDGINEMYIKTLLMLKRNKNLKYVFIATEPQIFNNTLSSNSSFISKYLLEVDDYLNVFNKTKLNVLTEEVPLLNDNFLKYTLNKFYNNFKPKKTEITKNWNSLSDEQRYNIAKNTGKIDHSSIMTNEKYNETYKAIVNICKKNNIKVIGIRFPVSEQYIGACKKEDIEKVDKFIDSLNLDYHLDYSMEINTPRLFHDEDHLNKEGVTKLSEIILKDIGIKINN